MLDWVLLILVLEILWWLSVGWVLFEIRQLWAAIAEIPISYP